VDRLSGCGWPDGIYLQYTKGWYSIRHADPSSFSGGWIGVVREGAWAFQRGGGWNIPQSDGTVVGYGHADTVPDFGEDTTGLWDPGKGAGNYDPYVVTVHTGGCSRSLICMKEFYPDNWESPCPPGYEGGGGWCYTNETVQSCDECNQNGYDGTLGGYVSSYCYPGPYEPNPLP
jgi:hypothetical protein